MVILIEIDRREGRLKWANRWRHLQWKSVSRLAVPSILPMFLSRRRHSANKTRKYKMNRQVSSAAVFSAENWGFKGVVVKSKL
jgi:hypothetical protein